MSDDLRIEAKFKNARLFNAIHDAVVVDKDYRNSFARGRVAAWCRQHGLPLQHVYELLNLRKGPLTELGKVREICNRIASILGKDITWLFPEHLYSIEWPVGVALETSSGRFLPLSSVDRILSLPPAQDDDDRQRDIKKMVAAALDTLTPREAQVIRDRFGLRSDEKTLRETGKRLYVSAQRARDIEMKALDKLRRKSALKELA